MEARRESQGTAGVFPCRSRMKPGRIAAWQCIGCGKIEAPQTCVGVCQDRRVDLVSAEAHEAALADAERKIKALGTLVRQLAQTTPRDGEWERSWRILQDKARQTLEALAVDPRE